MKKTILLSLLCAVAMITACGATNGNNKNLVLQNKTIFEDVIITADEFNFALLHLSDYNYTRLERKPLANDTSIVREWWENQGQEFQSNYMEECGYYSFDSICFVEICVGDYCCTRFHGDTTLVPSFDISLSYNGFLGNIVTEWNVDDVPAYIYVYPFDFENKRLGSPFIYETTPNWIPSGNYSFWAENGWFYVEAYDSKVNKTEYHKVRVRNIENGYGKETSLQKSE